MSSTSNEHQVEELLADLPPEPSPQLKQRLVSAPWTTHGIKRRQTLTVIYLTVTLLVGLIGFTPQGRAFAQSIIKFFTTTDKDSIQLSDEEVNWYYTPVPTRALSLVNVTPLPTSLDDCSALSSRYECEIRKIERQLSIDLKEFSTPPPGWRFTTVDSYTAAVATYTGTMIDISYKTSGGYLDLMQGNGDFPPDQEVLASAVERVQIGQYYGEYVNGGFWLRNGDKNITWTSEGTDQRIRWKEG